MLKLRVEKSRLSILGELAFSRIFPGLLSSCQYGRQLFHRCGDQSRRIDGPSANVRIPATVIDSTMSV
jgi:hypothetical protein